MAGVSMAQRDEAAVQEQERERTQRSDQWTRVAGVAFAVLFVVGFSLVSWTWDTNDDAEIVAWYADSGHRTQQGIGVFVVAAAGLALLRFLSGLRAHVSGQAGGSAPTTMLTAGGVFTALLFVGSAAIAAVSGGVEFGDDPLPTDAGLIRVVASVGYGTVLGFGGLAAALCVLTATLAGRRSDVFPKWLGVVGYVAAGVLLASVIYLPLVAFPIWAVLVSVWGLRPRPPAITLT